MPRTNSRLSQVLRMLAPRACAVCGCRLATEEEVICGACDFHLPRTNYAHWPAQNEMARLFWLRLHREGCRLVPLPRTLGSSPHDL